MNGWSNFSRISLSTIVSNDVKTIKKWLRSLRLTSDSGNLVSLDEQVLQNRLHSKNLLCLIVLHKVYFAISAPADRLQDSEITLLHGRLIG